MNKKPLVSICVPVYNVEKYIKRCAISLFEQTYSNIEIIFVNDCSQDKSMQILERIIDKYPNKNDRIHIINHTINRGLAAARISAIKLSKGEYIMHVDSDDYISINTVEAVMKEQASENYDIISFGCYRESMHKTIIQMPPKMNNSKEMCLKLLSKDVNVGVWGRLFKKSLIIKNEIYPKEGVDMGEDYQVTTKSFFFAKKILNLELPLYHYNQINTSSYVNTFSANIIFQNHESFRLVRDFFFSKGSEYVHEIFKAEIKLLINTLIQIMKNSNDEKLFNVYYEKLNKIPKCYWHCIPFSKRFIIYLKSYTMIRLYIKIIFLVKNEKYRKNIR